MLELPVITRSCGGCTACCKTHIGSEMKAAGGEYCDFCQIGKGCSIYERRPFACQVYRCLWVCGKGEESDRPDRLKIVLDLKAVHFYEEDIVALNLWEVEEGAINQPRVQQIMVANIEGGNVVVCRPYQEEPTYYFPKGVFSADEQQEFIEILKRTPGALGV